MRKFSETLFQRYPRQGYPRNRARTRISQTPDLNLKVVQAGPPPGGGLVSRWKAWDQATRRYAIRNECRSGRRVIKTINSLKRTKRMYRFKVLSERSIWKSQVQTETFQNLTNSVIENAEFASCRCSVYKQSFHKLWKYIVLEHGPWTLT